MDLTNINIFDFILKLELASSNCLMAEWMLVRVGRLKISMNWFGSTSILLNINS